MFDSKKGEYLRVALVVEEKRSGQLFNMLWNLDADDRLSSNHSHENRKPNSSDALFYGDGIQSFYHLSPALLQDLLRTLYQFLGQPFLPYNLEIL